MVGKSQLLPVQMQAAKLQYLVDSIQISMLVEGGALGAKGRDNYQMRRNSLVISRLM